MTNSTPLSAGDAVRPFVLPALDGSPFDLTSLNGRRFLLTFFRFAACPFCNMRVHELVQRHAELGSEFGVVAVFDSPLDHLRRYAERHDAPFPILADEGGVVHRTYVTEHSLGGVVRGIVTRAPTLLKAMSRGYAPTSLRGDFTGMPASFLVDESGTVRVAHYGSDEGDHLPIEEVALFAHGAPHGAA